MGKYDDKGEGGWLREIAKQVHAQIEEFGWEGFLERSRNAPKLPFQQEWFEVGMSLNEEKSDRALAIVAAAFLDDVLGEMITRRLSNVEPGIVGSVCPRPGEFGRRINMAVCLGLLGPSEAADLRAIKKIRDRFAHRAFELSFEEKDVKAACGSFLVLQNTTADGEPLDYSKWSARDRFRMAAFSLTSHLQTMIVTVERLAAKRDGEFPFGLTFDHTPESDSAISS